MSYSGGMGGGLLQIQQYEHSHMHTLGDISVKLRKQVHQNMKNFTQIWMLNDFLFKYEKYTHM